MGARGKPNVDYMSIVTGVERNPSDGSPARVPCEAPIHGVRVNGTDNAPGGLNFRNELSARFMLRDHPQEAQPLPDVKDGVSALEVRTEEYRGTALESPYRRVAFAGAPLPNRIPKDHVELVRSEVAALLERGYPMKSADVQISTGPETN